MKLAKGMNRVYLMGVLLSLAHLHLVRTMKCGLHTQHTCHILNIEICIIAMKICVNLYHSNIETILSLYLSHIPEQRLYLHSIAFPAITCHAVSYRFASNHGHSSLNLVVKPVFTPTMTLASSVAITTQ